MSKATTTLGLDLAGRCGWAVITTFDDGRAPEFRCGSWDCTKGNHQGEELSDRLTRLIRRQRELGRPISSAMIEAPIRRVPTKKVQIRPGKWAEVLDGHPNTAFILNSMEGSARAILRQFKIPCDEVASSTWRKIVLGIGRAPKDSPSNWFKKEMVFRAEMLGDRFDFEIPNHDAADALGVCIAAVAQRGHLPAGILVGRGSTPSLFQQALRG